MNTKTETTAAKTEAKTETTKVARPSKIAPVRDKVLEALQKGTIQVSTLAADLSKTLKMDVTDRMVRQSIDSLRANKTAIDRVEKGCFALSKPASGKKAA